MNTKRIRELLRGFAFEQLFIHELGWDHHSGRLELTVDGHTCALEAVAHKRGMVAYVCAFPNGVHIPYPVRCKLETQVARTVREHLIVFTDEGKKLQIWQWVKREQNKPVARREHVYSATQSGDALIQKLEYLEVTLEEEEDVDLLGVTTKARKAFDIDKVTRKFYDLFKKQHSAFLKAIDGIPEQGDREWYASIMLNRLMFTWFIQAKGFLDKDKRYLRNRLKMVQEQRGKNRFLSFYRSFLLKLFHDGFGKRKRDAATEKLLGRIPFLNGGVFEVHKLEEKYGEIDIADKAFETLFDFFDQYEWRLDNRPTHDDREINPDVLGYIFEKYINQKQMGAYYTKEDITEYIGKNTVIPFLFDKTRRAMEKKKMGAGYAEVFSLLKADSDRYIYDAMRHGYYVDEPSRLLETRRDAASTQRTIRALPSEIAEGLDTKKPNLLERRKAWNRSAPLEYALPTEIWREVVDRRQRYEEICKKLKTGRVAEINDLITLNLNIRQFAQDAIENCADPHLLNAFWKAVSEITILDPTCGSGAFLFAALNILEPLYEACLDRMRAFMLEWSEQTKITHTNYYKDFVAVLARTDEHYFIFKTIIINNLYGVDLMEEAVEICKLRLFLKLAAQVEPLPDIDFNIRAGNTLVGFATEAEVRRQMTEFQGRQMKMNLPATAGSKSA